MKQLIKSAILGVANRSRAVRQTAAFIVRQASDGSDSRDGYGYLKQKFIANGVNSSFGTPIRSEMVRRFERIDKDVPMGTTATDGLFLAEMLLNMEADGSIIECGCYAGGSSAKLSIVAKLLGRKLTVFDSFEGLPVVEERYLRDQHCRRSDEWVTDWKAGRYAARLDEVQGNIERYGEISVCSFVKGWFNETLTDKNLPQKIAFAFTDVDLANSARDCFRAIWPRLTRQGIFVTHDTSYIKVLQEFYNPEVWADEFKSMPPILFGAGFGLCNSSPHIGYMVKGDSLSPEYLKSLTIDK